MRRALGMPLVGFSSARLMRETVRGARSASFHAYRRCAMSSIVSRTLSVHKEHEMLLKLEAAGLTDELAQRIINSKGNELATKVVELIQDDSGLEAATSQNRARYLLERNFFGVEEAIRHFGVNPTKHQLVALDKIPFTEAVLRECRNTHLLRAVFPLSILDIRDKVERRFFYNHEGAWYNEQAFANIRGDARWQLVRKTPIGNSTGKNWTRQQALLAKDEETPTAQAMVYTIISHFLATGERLFENVNVRCLDVDSDGHRVGIGRFDADGLRIHEYYRDDICSDSLGLSSVRKTG